MKKILLLILLFNFYEGYSQITLDFQSSNIYLWPIKLSNSVTKYIDVTELNTQNQFSLLNFDGSLFKTIHLPPKPDPSALVEAVYGITYALFDTDSSNIEYLVHYDPCDSSQSGAPWRVEIVREDGTILLDEAYASFDYLYLFNTEQGSKLLMMYFDGNSQPYEIKIFSLPGEFPTAVNDEAKVNDYPISLYPNPNKGLFFLKFNGMPSGTNNIELYSNDGRLIDTYKSNGNPTQINTHGLSNGTYYLHSSSNHRTNSSKMIIQK